MDNPLYELIPAALASVKRAVEHGKEMLAEEEQKLAVLPSSPECAQAIAEQNERIRQAKRNLALAERAAARLKKRAQKLYV